MSINPAVKLAVSFCLAAGPLSADVPRVVTDILPVHSLVSAVMEGLGSPDLLIEPGASPHTAALRPSQAGALSDADLVIWMGEGLTPSLPERIDALAGDAVVLDLSELEGQLRLAFREEFHNDHGDHAEHDDHADHDDHAEHAEHAEHDEHDDHDDHEDHAGHDHGDFDPHLWLDPDIARDWLPIIAEALTDLDPENGAQYRVNALSTSAALRDQIEGTEGLLATFGAPRALVGHDAYQYYEARFDTPILGAITLADDAAPSAGRLDALRDQIADVGAACILVEPQFDRRLVDAVASDVQLIEADPLGSTLEPGPTLYPQLIEDLTLALVNCR